MSIHTVTINDHVSSVQHEDWSEFFFTTNASSSINIEEDILAYNEKQNSTLISQYVFSGIDHYQPKKNQLQSAVWIQGDACTKGEKLSSQGWGISNKTSKDVVFKGEKCGVIYEDEYALYVRLNGIKPDNINGSQREQTESLFQNLNDVLQSVDFKFNDTIRTWYYLADLLDWYDIFNEVRTTFFNQQNVFDKLVPVSTGIGAKNQYHAAAIADLLAVQIKDPKKMAVHTIPSPLQEPAMDYKSSFSRALEILTPNLRNIYISGTASIDSNGKTVFLEDPVKQIEKTMDVIHAILQSKGMDWADITRGIVYYKDMTFEPLFINYCKKHNIPNYPLAVAHADVCRDDLLFEIEVDAAKEI